MGGWVNIAALKSLEGIFEGALIEAATKGVAYITTRRAPQMETTMVQADRQDCVEITPQMVDAGICACLRVEDETLGRLSRSSLERLVVEVWGDMDAARQARD